LLQHSYQPIVNVSSKSCVVELVSEGKSKAIMVKRYFRIVW